MGIRNLFNGMVQAREKQARRYVVGSLLSMDDATLKAAGYDREALKKERHVSFGAF